MTDKLESTAADRGDRSPLERALGVITEIRAGEGITALLLTLNVFLLLTAYYVIKPVREGLVDTFFIRMGDVASAGLVFLGGAILGWPARSFALVNVGLVAVWILLARRIVIENRALTEPTRVVPAHNGGPASR